MTSNSNLIGQEHKVLDHGMIRVVDVMGSDKSVVDSARISYQSGTKVLNNDQGLVKYLMRNFHLSPFESAVIQFHIKMPMFVARQWSRHRMASYNEVSARYSVLPKEFYVPTKDQLCKQCQLNKQSKDEKLGDKDANEVIARITKSSIDAYNEYEKLLEMGLCRELARTVLSVNFYTEIYFTSNLRNLLHFINLRNSPHAQYEICLLYTSPSPRDRTRSRMPSSA